MEEERKKIFEDCAILDEIELDIACVKRLVTIWDERVAIRILKEAIKDIEKSI